MKVLFYLSAFLAISVHAESSNSQVVTLNDIRAHAVLHSVEVKKIDRAISQQFSDALQIDKLSNPTLGAQVGIPFDYRGERPTTQIQVALQQKIRMSDFGIRSALSSTLAKTSELEKQRELQKFLQRVALTYFKLWARREEKHHINDQRRRSARILKIVKDSKQQGIASALDVKVAESNHARLESDLLGVKAQIQLSEQKLLQLSSMDVRQVKLIKPVIAELSPFEDLLRLARTSQHSIGQRNELYLQLAREQYELAKKDSFSGISPQLIYSRNEDGLDFVGFGISLPLPFFQRNQADRAKASVELALQRRQREYLAGDEFRAEFESLYQRVEGKIQQSKMYEQAVVGGLRESLKLSEQAFADAQISLFELWTLQMQYHQAIDQSIQLWMESFAGLTELSIISGTLEI